MLPRLQITKSKSLRKQPGEGLQPGNELTYWNQCSIHSDCWRGDHQYTPFLRPQPLQLTQAPAHGILDCSCVLTMDTHASWNLLNKEGWRELLFLLLTVSIYLYCMVEEANLNTQQTVFELNGQLVSGLVIRVGKLQCAGLLSL